MTAGIAVRCTVRGGRVAAVALQPRRPHPVGKLAVGRKPAEAIQLFSSLFSLCPEAHCLAAGRALADALGLATPVELQDLQETRRELEIVKEHALNLLIHPSSSNPELAPALLNSYARLRAASGGTAIYWPIETPLNVDPAALQASLDDGDKILQALCGAFWRMAETDLATVRRWQERQDSPAARLLCRHAQPGWADFGRCDAALLPPLPAERLEPWLSDRPEELGTPTWEGTPRETGSYARQAETPLLQEARARYGNGLYPRTLARLAELKALFRSVRTRLAAGAPPLPPRCAKGSGTGLAQTEASRGRLIHHTVVVSGRITAYGILAPTEWNFHPRGLLPRALTGAPATAELPAQADALLRAVDPCVDFHLAFDYA